MNKLLTLIKREFDRTDITFLIGLCLIYYGLKQTDLVPSGIAEVVVGGLLASVSYLGYLRGK